MRIEKTLGEFFIDKQSIEMLLPGLALEYDYAFRRTLTRINQEIRTAQAAMKEDIEKVKAYETAAAIDPEKAQEEHAEGMRLQTDLKALKLSVEVFQVSPKIFEKGWPHDGRKCTFKIGDGKTADVPEEVLKGTLASLEMVRDE